MRHRTVSSRNAFLVDLAYMLLTRDRSFKECRVKFGWGDSSPQGGFDFLLLKYRYLPVKQLLQAAAALRKLIKTRGGSLGGGFDADDEVSLETVRARAAANLVLSKSVLEHLCVPCVMYVCRFVCCCGSVVAVAVAHACLVALFVASAGVAPFGVASDGCRLALLRLVRLLRLLLLMLLRLALLPMGVVVVVLLLPGFVGFGVGFGLAWVSCWNRCLVLVCFSVVVVAL
jgi:hypothetical protein